MAYKNLCISLHSPDCSSVDSNNWSLVWNSSEDQTKYVDMDHNNEKHVIMWVLSKWAQVYQNQYHKLIPILNWSPFEKKMMKLDSNAGSGKNEKLRYS
jgi:hypothetical protein